MKNTCKEEINYRVLEAINNSTGIHGNMERPTKESEVEKSLVEKITDIKNVWGHPHSSTAPSSVQSAILHHSSPL
jgi:hypothetical protein